MTEEEASHLRKENTELKEALARKDQRIEELEGLLMSAVLRIEELERRLAKDSHNSSKPPSSDGFKRKGKKWEANSKPKGGQPGHAGHTLAWVETPDLVAIHRPSHCEACQCELGAVIGQVKERRQVHDLPVLRLEVTEHQEEERLLVRISHLAAQFRAAGAQRLPQAERDGLVLQYFAILEQGFAFHRLHAPVPDVPIPKKPGRRKQADAKNLLDALLARAEQILAFLDDLSVPFTNNLAERDLRMIKVQQKISGTFRNEQGATAFCTMRKQGRSMLAALAAVLEGAPFPIAWEPGT